MIRTDQDIQEDIVSELKWDPSLRSEDIAVGVRDGVVTLAGTVDSYVDKWTAERIAGRIKGVKAIVNNLTVQLPGSSRRSDPDIAHAAVDALRWNVLVPSDRIKVKVEDGWVTLEGDVDWYYQKKAAERAVSHLTGVKGVINNISVRARPMPGDVKNKIKETLRRGAELDADRITIDVEGNKVILRGTVRSYVERKDAERAARNVPGVMEVENRLTVDPSVFAGV
jgi:osmotically-inducible protein OsmY